MRLLLDSCAIIWWMDDPRKMTECARAAIADPSNEVFFSAASVWELGLKMAKGKLRLPVDYVDRLREGGVYDLPITVEHAKASVALPLLHFDPFDRLLISQVIHEGLVIVTRDALIRTYPIAHLLA